MDKESPIGVFYQPLSRYGERFTDTRTRSKMANEDLSPVIHIFLNF